MRHRHSRSPIRTRPRRPVFIGVDFDGTLVEPAFPEIGAEIPLAVETLHVCMAAGAALVLWTRRTGEALAAAVAWCEARGLNLYGVNGRPDYPDSGPKPACDVFVDDCGLGCPVTTSEETHARIVDWSAARLLLLPIVGVEAE